MKSALFALLLALPLASAQAAPETAGARRGCGTIRLVPQEGRECLVQLFPDRVGGRARFSCGEEIFACICTEQGPRCLRQ